MTNVDKYTLNGTLIGASGYGADKKPLLKANLPGAMIFGAPGKSAYQLAVENGYEGTILEWLESLHGKSAYAYAVENGYRGTEADFAKALGRIEELKQAGATPEQAEQIQKNTAAIQKLQQNGGSGTPGSDGKDGATFIPALAADGTLSWSNNKGLDNPDPVNIMGPRGGDGSPGKNGVSPHVGSNGNWFIGETDTGIPATGPAGNQGLPGTPGEDGVPATHSWDGTVLTITSASGTSSADLKGDTGPQGPAGPKGDPGEKGDPGATGTQGPQGEKGDTGATGAKGDKGDTGATGPAGEDGKTPVRGTDYWTAADISEIKSYVDEAILGGAW